MLESDVEKRLFSQMGLTNNIHNMIKRDPLRPDGVSARDRANDAYKNSICKKEASDTHRI